MSIRNKSSQDRVMQFFDGYAEDFTKIYDERPGISLKNLADRILRKGMFARFAEVVDQCRLISANSALDVGCGPGIHDAYLAKNLGMTICGVDIAPRMIDIAKQNALAHGIESRCEYLVQDFFGLEKGRDFDIVYSLGVVEYIESPSAFIKKMISHARHNVIFSVPVKLHILTPQRVVRYKLRGCPLFFYTKKEIESLLADCNATSYEIKRAYRDYVVIVSLTDK